MLDLNLLPPKLRKNRQKKLFIESPTYGVGILILSVAVIVGVSAFSNYQVNELSTNIDNIQREIDVISSELNGLQTEDENQVQQELSSIFSKVQGLVNGGKPWVEILNEISYLTPSNVVISQIKELENGSISILGETYSLTDLAVLKESFSRKDSPFLNVILENYDFVSSTIVDKENSTIPFTIIFDYVGGEGSYEN